MAPDDIPVDHPASETQRKRTGRIDGAHRVVGPESEDRGGHEAPDSGLDGARRQPVGESRENNAIWSAGCSAGRSAGRGSARGDHKHKIAGGADPSDPPQPPGVPPEVPDPEKPVPIEEPPGPIPVPPNDPPPPIVAASRQASVRSSP